MVDNIDSRPDVKEGHMKQYASKVFCPAPFLHGYLNVTNSGFKLCCMSSIVDRLDVGKLNEKNIGEQFQEHWNGEVIQNVRKSFLKGEWPTTETKEGTSGKDQYQKGPCDYCKKYEDEGVYKESARTQMLEKFNDVNPEEIEFDIVKGNKYNKPIDLDVRPGKLCNLTCRTCSSIWSSSIENDVIDNYRDLRHTYWDMFSTSRWQMRIENAIDWNADNTHFYDNWDLEGVRYLKMSGGETLIDPNCYKIWEQLVEKGYAKNIQLHLITNGTSWNKRAYELLSQFKEVRIRLSLDGYGKINDYIRAGSRFEKVISNYRQILELPNLKDISFMKVVSVFNAFDIYNFTKFWLEEYRAVNRTDNRPHFIVPAYLPLDQPMFVSIAWLDDEDKDFIRGEMERAIKDFNMDDIEQECFPTVHSEMNRPIDEKMPTDVFESWKWQVSNKEANRKQFIHHATALDKVKNTNLFDYVPQLEKYFNI